MAKYYGDIPCVKQNACVVKNGVIRDLQIGKILKQRI